ncbi:MAG: CcmD family protein [Candidatus Zixiibacteriota bacterium]
MDTNYTAMIAVLITWGGIAWYLWRIDRKISRRGPSA